MTTSPDFDRAQALLLAADQSLLVIADQLEATKARLQRIEAAVSQVFGHSLMQQMAQTNQPTEGSLWHRLQKLREAVEGP